MIVLLQRVLEAQVVRRAEGGQAEEPLGAVGRGLLVLRAALARTAGLRLCRTGRQRSSDR